jgi:hypothetical protein
MDKIPYSSVFVSDSARNGKIPTVLQCYESLKSLKPVTQRRLSGNSLDGSGMAGTSKKAGHEATQEYWEENVAMITDALQPRFEAIDRRFDNVDNRLDDIGNSLTAIKRHLGIK